MHTVSEALSTLNGMAVPAAFVTACSLLLLGVYDKYSKIVASLRSLRGEVREHLEGGVNVPAYRERQIESECAMLQKRLKNVLAQILSVATGMILFLLASLAIGAADIMRAPSAGIAVIFVVLGVAAMIVAMAMAAGEARFIWDVMTTELSTPAGTPASATRSYGADGHAHERLNR
jgi:hypothetical protein